jgi:hypothetical protein
MEIDFIWHPKKATRNLAKHGVSFEDGEGRLLRSGPSITEDRESGDELRYHALRRAGSGILLLAVFVDRADETREIIRIISAREANKHEQRAYADQFEKGN